MYMSLNREELKRRLSDIENASDFEQAISKLESWSSSKTEIIWAAVELAKEDHLDFALKIARRYITDPDPTENHDLNIETIKGGDAAIISTVRATVAYLLQAVIARLKPEYYSEAILLIDTLAHDEVAYVRKHSCVPLEGLTKNFYAVKNKDGTPFNFKDEDKKKVFDLAFYLLRTTEYPRVLEYLVGAIGNLRMVNETEAEEILNKLFFSNKGKDSLRPDYLIDRAIPLALYFAEFRKDARDGFKNDFFVNFLNNLIRKLPPRSEESIVWHIWKTVEEDNSLWWRFKKYIPLFFEGKYEGERLTQFDFLIEKIIKNYPEDAINIFIEKVSFIQNNLARLNDLQRGAIWFYNSEIVLRVVARIQPTKYLDLLKSVINLYKFNGIYIGNIDQILNSCEDIESREDREHVVKEVEKIKEGLVVG